LALTPQTKTTKSVRKGSVIGVHREKVRVQLGGDVTGCHSPMSVGDDVTALTPAEKHTHRAIYKLLSCDRTDFDGYKLKRI